MLFVLRPETIQRFKMAALKRRLKFKDFFDQVVSAGLDALANGGKK